MKFHLLKCEINHLIAIYFIQNLFILWWLERNLILFGSTNRFEADKIKEFKIQYLNIKLSK